MPSYYGRVSRLEVTYCAPIIFEIIHIFINVHHVVSLSSFSIPINEIFFETLLKCHEMSSNKRAHHLFHCPLTPTLSSEWGQHCDSFNLGCMCRILTWLDKTHTFMVWEGFKAQVCMSCLHNIFDHPHFHQRSSCSLIVIILHSPLMPLSTNIAL